MVILMIKSIVFSLGQTTATVAVMSIDGSSIAPHHVVGTIELHRRTDAQIYNRMQVLGLMSFSRGHLHSLCSEGRRSSWHVDKLK